MIDRIRSFIKGDQVKLKTKEELIALGYEYDSDDDDYERKLDDKDYAMLNVSVNRGRILINGDMILQLGKTVLVINLLAPESRYDYELSGGYSWPEEAIVGGKIFLNAKYGNNTDICNIIVPDAITINLNQNF